ncbi:MAG: hypothetical protein HC877_23015, partial [Thioploca sp.]|nr:hypothetical protein [Thioploca sp.]
GFSGVCGGAHVHACGAFREFAHSAEGGRSDEEYLAGLCDLSGELARRAVLRAVVKDVKAVAGIREFVVGLQGGFLKFDLRNGELRKKADQIKWNLKRIEDVWYDLSRP